MAAYLPARSEIGRAGFFMPTTQKESAMPVIEQLDHALTAIAALRRHNTDSDVDVILAAIERTMDNAFVLLASGK
jgi:hypothetical protein